MNVFAPCSNPGRRGSRRRKLQFPARAGIAARHGAESLFGVARLWARRQQANDRLCHSYFKPRANSAEAINQLILNDF
jgi:hypothetical protein